MQNTISKDPCTHGAVLVPIVAGSDKTTVLVATGHQEYHSVYILPGNFTNTAHCGHSNSVLPVAFLPILKSKCPSPDFCLSLNCSLHILASKHQAEHPEFQQFVHQMYHMCLAWIFAPLKAAMTEPEVVLCPDGYFQHAIYLLGPYIADYPEQVWLAGTVYWWCPKYISQILRAFVIASWHWLSFRCDAQPGNLDKKNAHWRSHERSDFIINSFDPGIVWHEHGI